MFLELHEAMIRYQIGYCNGLCGFWESRGCKICKTAWISLASSSPASEPITRGIADVFAPIAAAKMRNDSRFHNISASLWYLVLPFAIKHGFSWFDYALAVHPACIFLWRSSKLVLASRISLERSQAIANRSCRPCDRSAKASGPSLLLYLVAFM